MCMMCFTLIGDICKLTMYDSGEYKYVVNTLKDGTRQAYCIGLTDQGT